MGDMRKTTQIQTASGLIADMRIYRDYKDYEFNIYRTYSQVLVDLLQAD